MTTSNMMLTFLIIIFCASIDGISTAVVGWTDKRYLTFKWDGHYLLLFQRLLFIVALLITCHWVGLLAGLLSYAYFHNAYYRLGLKKVDGAYPAFTQGNFFGELRVLLLIAGITTLLMGIFFSTQGKF